MFRVFARNCFSRVKKPIVKPNVVKHQKEMDENAKNLKELEHGIDQGIGKDIDDYIESLGFVSFEEAIDRINQDIYNDKGEFAKLQHKFAPKFSKIVESNKNPYPEDIGDILAKKPKK